MDRSRPDTVGDTDTVSMSMDLPLLTGLGLTQLPHWGADTSLMFTEYLCYIQLFNCVSAL